MKEKIPEDLQITFFDHERSLLDILKNSAKRRSQSLLSFIFRKIRNIIFYRLSLFCPLNSIRIKMHRSRGIKIGKGTYIGQQVYIDNAYPEFVFIGNNVSINQGTTILAHTNPMSHFDGLIIPSVKPVIIDDYAMIGINSTLLPGVRIGKCAFVSAGSVVTHNVQDYTLVHGNPAKKTINYEHLLTQNPGD